MVPFVVRAMPFSKRELTWNEEVFAGFAILILLVLAIFFLWIEPNISDYGSASVHAGYEQGFPPTAR